MKKKELEFKRNTFEWFMYCVDVEYCENLFLLLVRHV